MKKFISIAVIAAMIAALSGCSGSSEAPQNEADIISFTTKPDDDAPATTPNSSTKPEETVDALTTTAEEKTLDGEGTDAPKTDSSATSKADEPSTPPSTEAPGNAPSDYNVIGENNILVISKDGHYTGLMGCWGTIENCDKYVDYVETFSDRLPDVNVYSMIVPTSVEFYLPAKNDGYSASQKKKIDHIAAAFKDVINVDAYSQLSAHADEYIYARTDHHWQPLGAYYAAKAFADVANFNFPSLSDYKKVTKEGYIGSMYNYSQDSHLGNDPEPFTMYISPNDADLKTTYYDQYFKNGYESDLFVSRSAASYYCSFLGSDDRIAKIETGVKNGKTLVVIKESYGNAVIPFLTSGFETIYVLDLRYLEKNAVQFCKDVGATDLLFSMCTFTPAGGNCSYLKYILNL